MFGTLGPVVLAAVAGLVLGGGAGVSVRSLVRTERRRWQYAEMSRAWRWQWPLVMAVVAAAMLAGLVTVELVSPTQLTPEVQPSETGRVWRTAYHAVLCLGLIAAVAVDLDCYLIPDAVTFPITLLGVLGAIVIGEAQIMHLWVDWNAAIPGMTGPEIPAWIDSQRQWHGLAWSVAGAVVGGGAVLLMQWLSRLVLGQAGLGTGDATLMMMVGSFLGWQATLCVLVVAPLAAAVWLIVLAIGGPRRSYAGSANAVRGNGEEPAAVTQPIVSDQEPPMMPFGPGLATAAYAVLLGWGPIWSQTRYLFGDPVVLAIAGVGAAAGLVVLLGLSRSLPRRG